MLIIYLAKQDSDQQPKHILYHSNKDNGASRPQEGSALNGWRAPWSGVVSLHG
jgi:hypothetical protein